MSTRAVVRHRTGTVRLEDGRVVIHLEGTRSVGVLRRRQEPWTQDYEVPIEQATVVPQGADLAIYRDGRAIQDVFQVDAAEVGAFLDALDDERLRRQLVTASCSNCGAPGQTVGRVCGYCGRRVAG
jgi:hypothetical protein